MSRAPLLRVEGLTKEFRVRRGMLRMERDVRGAVADVSFDIYRGETFALVGESGCGKSTTARAILRLVEPSGGRVTFDGEDVLAMGRAELQRFRRKAQIVFQNTMGALNPRLRAAAVLREVLHVHGTGGPDPEARVVELLEQVGLGREQSDRFPHELSGGQRQRLSIARALSVEPEILILDEPVSALDVSVQGQVMNLLLDLQTSLGLTYLFIAHDLSLVRRFAQRTAVMYLGRIVESAPTDVLFRAARHPYTKALLSAVPVLSTEAGPRVPRDVLAGDVPRERSAGAGCAFHPRCPHSLKDDSCLVRTPPLEPVAGEGLVACVKAAGARHSGA